MKTAFFLTGTDTDVGKTVVACQLLQLAQQRGLKTLGLKPVAAGAEKTAAGLRNDDALLLQATSTLQLPYALVNPFCFADAVAPHLATQQADTPLNAADIAQHVQHVLDTADYDYAIIEGAGGWRVPVNETETLADVAKLLQLPVILVVGMKLGCINHALLAAEAIRADDLTLAGWVANDLGEPMPLLAENIATLEHWLPAPRLDFTYRV
jgi:dethiobiotin synthetase